MLALGLSPNQNIVVSFKDSDGTVHEARIHGRPDCRVPIYIDAEKDIDIAREYKDGTAAYKAPGHIDPCWECDQSWAGSASG